MLFRSGTIFGVRTRTGSILPTADPATTTVAHTTASLISANFCTDSAHTSAEAEGPSGYPSRAYFQGHPIKVVSTFPLEKILRNSNATGRVVEWAVKLQPFELEFLTTKTIKGGTLAKFNAEWTNPPSEDEPGEEG